MRKGAIGRLGSDGSVEQTRPDGQEPDRPSRYFYWDESPASGRAMTNSPASEALERARALARAGAAKHTSHPCARAEAEETPEMPYDRSKIRRSMRIETPVEFVDRQG
jgi:hypothetical protein